MKLYFSKTFHIDLADFIPYTKAQDDEVYMS
jgi:hypothetical protein